MNLFRFYFKLGLDHVLDIQAYDHILFLIVLVVPYLLKDWKKIFWLVTTFTVGHTISLFLSIYGILKMNENLVEFLIPITITTTAFYNIFTSEKNHQKSGFWFFIIATLLFGIIHGLGFSGYFRQIIADQNNKFISILEFALGIEVSQLIIVITTIFISWIAQFTLNFSKREWILVTSSIVIGICLPMILERI